MKKVVLCWIVAGLLAAGAFPVGARSPVRTARGMACCMKMAGGMGACQTMSAAFCCGCGSDPQAATFVPLPPFDLPSALRLPDVSGGDRLASQPAPRPESTPHPLFDPPPRR